MCSAFNTSSRTLGHSGFNAATVVPIDRTENNNIIIYGRIICELAKFVLLYPLSRPPVRRSIFLFYLIYTDSAMIPSTYRLSEIY